MTQSTKNQIKEYIREEVLNHTKTLKENKELRKVKVNFENGDSISTNMASHLTDQEILDYYKVGKEFNLGNPEDNMTKVKSVEILDKQDVVTETLDYGNDGTQEKVDYFLNDLDNQGKLEYLDTIKNKWIPDFKNKVATSKNDKVKYIFQSQLTYLTDKLLPIIEDLISKEGKEVNDQSELNEEVNGKFIDLFVNYEEQPAKLKAIFGTNGPNGYTYDSLEKLLKDVKRIGYTFDYGLDADPYGLRPIGVKLEDLEGYDE